MRGNWTTALVAAVVIFAAVVAAKYFFAAGGTDTQDLPREYAGGNPLALRELEQRPYDGSLSKAFRAMASDPDPKVQTAAILFLAKGTGPAEEAVLVSALGDENPEVRAAAASACAQRKLKRAIGPLIGLIEDPSVEVKSAALSALRQITGKSGYLTRNEWEEWWRLHKEGFD